jgi:hypothetical protein
LTCLVFGTVVKPPDLVLTGRLTFEHWCVLQVATVLRRVATVATVVHPRVVTVTTTALRRAAAMAVSRPHRMASCDWPAFHFGACYCDCASLVGGYGPPQGGGYGDYGAPPAGGAPAQGAYDQGGYGQPPAQQWQGGGSYGGYEGGGYGAGPPAAADGGYGMKGAAPDRYRPY